MGRPNQVVGRPNQVVGKPNQVVEFNGLHMHLDVYNKENALQLKTPEMMIRHFQKLGIEKKYHIAPYSKLIKSNWAKKHPNKSLRKEDYIHEHRVWMMGS